MAIWLDVSRQKWAGGVADHRRIESLWSMTVKLRQKGAERRSIIYPDDETHRFTAREFAGGRIEVTEKGRGDTGPGVVVGQFDARDYQVVENGWPTDE